MKKLIRNDERMRSGKDTFVFGSTKSVFHKVPDSIAREAAASGRFRIVEEVPKKEGSEK